MHVHMLVNVTATNTMCIERLHIHSNETKHKNNHGYSVKLAILLF